METKQLNLCELLKGHEGEAFYSPFYGDVTLEEIHTPTVVMPKYYLLVRPKSYSVGRELILPNGINHDGGQVVLYPSRALYEKYPLDAAKAWSEWYNAQKSRVWNDVKKPLGYCLNLCAQHTLPINKAVSAMFKLRHLIELSYGGNPTTAEKRLFDLYVMDWVHGEWRVIKQCEYIDIIAFYTRKQAEDFLSHPENRQLLDEFYMTKDE